MQDEVGFAPANEPSTESETFRDTEAAVDNSSSGGDELESVVDISGKSLELSLLGDGSGAGFSGEKSVDGLYVYRNVFNLLPKSLGVCAGGSLKFLKFFANEVNLFPPEFGNLVELERLQVRVSDLGFNGVPLHKLKALKELELSKAPPRPSSFPVIGEIAGLKCLTRLSICHFSIRYLPPEIGSLKKLEYLDLSFNKMRSLPNEISTLKALLSLKVANNKLEELPMSLSSLQKLVYLNLSRNRLRSLGSLGLSSMHNLQKLNLQYNKLLSCEVPSWIHCELEGNCEGECTVEFVNSVVEMDVSEAFIADNRRISFEVSSNTTSSCHHIGSSSNSRSHVTRRLAKRWKRRQYLQQRARHDRLTSSRKWKHDVNSNTFTSQSLKKCEVCKEDPLGSEESPKYESGITCLCDDSKMVLPQDGDQKKFLDTDEEQISKLKNRPDSESCSCVEGSASCEDLDEPPACFESAEKSDVDESSACSASTSEHEARSSIEVHKSISKLKRHSDLLFGDTKPRKHLRSTDNQQEISQKYNFHSFCGINDHVSDGFYDAGRDRPFMSLGSYDQTLNLDSREVILLDRNKDEELGAIILSAQASVSRLRKFYGSKHLENQVPDDNLLVASWLALFVSDHFGGNDKSSLVERARKDVAAANYFKPFVCTCSAGNSEIIKESTRQTLETEEDIVFHKICERSIRSIKERRNSVIVPIGSLQFGVCRHRAVLMKYICDRMDPPVPCELIRGYMDFCPHAWNAIHIKRAGSWVRMIVDACRPHDIREETDPEYFCRYIPLTRVIAPFNSKGNPVSSYSLPSLSFGEEFEKAPSSSLVICKVGSTEAAAKVRTLEASDTPGDEIRNFEYGCLGEVRILGAVRGHPCIVNIYGHQISSKWIPSSDGTPMRRVLQSTVFMEFVKGGSLKRYLQQLLEAGKNHIPVGLVLTIAREIACGLKELHSKHIIHRDIKSENILIDLVTKRDDGSPIIKICDFDQAVPLKSTMHTCCISHKGIPSPTICVGTPRWFAPEVFCAIREHNRYGLEVDVWSYGCLILELLTLQVPYAGLSDSQIHQHLQAGKRPPLTDDLEALRTSQSPSPSSSSSPPSLKEGRPRDREIPEESTMHAEEEELRFLVDLYYRCTEKDPSKRPTAEYLHEVIAERVNSCSACLS